MACGTRAGYVQHQLLDTPPCVACLDANAAVVKASRVRTGKTRRLTIPVDVLRQTIETDSCAPLLAFLGEEVAEAVKDAPKALERSDPK